MEENRSTPLDYSLMTYEEWVKLLFEEELKKSDDDNPFYKYNIEGHPQTPAVLLSHVTRLCRDLPNLVKNYSMKHIGQGLWQAICYCDSPRINFLLWNPDLPLEAKLDCIRAMKVVFTDVVAKISPEEEIAPVFEMWWEDVCVYQDSADYMNNSGYEGFQELYRDWRSQYSLKTPLGGVDLKTFLAQIREKRKAVVPPDFVYKTYVLPILMDDTLQTDAERLQQIHDLHPQHGAELNYDFMDWKEEEIREFREQTRPLIDTAFQILREILEIGEPRCETCAIHGLGHLLHPDKPALIQKYIDQHRGSLDAGFLEWLEECRNGAMM